MKQRILVMFINTVFFTLVVAIAISIATIAYTRKENQLALQYRQGITGSVIKGEIPILALADGIVNKIYVKTGDRIRKGDTLVVMDNPSLRSKVSTLEQFTNNESAQTEAKVDEQILKNLTITAPEDGTIGQVYVSEGDPINSLSKILQIYSSQNIRLLANLTVDEYQSVKQLRYIQAYNERLNQSFAILPDILNPSIDTPKDATQVKKIGLFFKFENPKDAESLLNNEDLELDLNQGSAKINKPIDYFVSFWNQLVAHGVHN